MCLEICYEEKDKSKRRPTSSPAPTGECLVLDLGPFAGTSGSLPSLLIVCPWCTSLSMSVSLSVVVFCCLIGALCFVLKRKNG